MPPRALLVGLAALLAAAPAAVGDHGGLPDLVGHVWPTDATPGTPVRLYGFVQNAGHAGAGSVEVALLVNGTPFETLRVGPLPAGEDAWFQTAANVTLDEAVHAFEVRVDAADEVAESREDNNVNVTEVLFTHQRPDLALRITSVHVEDWPKPRVLVAYRACNQGNRTAGEAVVVSGAFLGHGIPGVAPGEVPFAPHAHGPLDPGACVAGTFEADAPYDLAGYRTVLARADATGGPTVWERDPENNRHARNVWMGPGPDPRL